MRSSTSDPDASAPTPPPSRTHAADPTPRHAHDLTRKTAIPLIVTLALGALAAAVAGHWFIDLHVYLLGARHAFTSDL